VEYVVLGGGLSLPNCRVLIALVIGFCMVSCAVVDQSPAQQQYTVSFYTYSACYKIHICVACRFFFLWASHLPESDILWIFIMCCPIQTSQFGLLYFHLLPVFWK